MCFGVWGAKKTPLFLVHLNPTPVHTMADEKPKKKPAVRKVAKKRTTKSAKRTKQQLHDLITEGLANILLGEKIPLEIKNSETGEIIMDQKTINKARLSVEKMVAIGR